MKANIKTLWLASLVAFALVAPSTPAQRVKFPLHPAPAVNGDTSEGPTGERPKKDATAADVVNDCAYQFTTGSGLTYLQFCVTENGNISEFQSPKGIEQLNPQDIGAFEGYGICDVTNNSTAYYDYLFTASSNWNPPTKLSQTATEVKIERSTSDGLWTLTETVSMVGGTTPFAKITMALKNNSSIPKEAYLIRYANPLPDNAGAVGNDNENFDGNADSAWGYTANDSTNGSDPFGLMLQNVGDPTPTNVPFAAEGFAITNYLIDPCNPFANLTSPITNEFGSVVYIYQVDFGKEQTFTVNDRYMWF